MSLAPLYGTHFRRPLGFRLVRGNVGKNLKLGHPLHLTGVDLIAKPPYNLGSCWVDSKRGYMNSKVRDC